MWHHKLFYLVHPLLPAALRGFKGSGVFGPLTNAHVAKFTTANIYLPRLVCQRQFSYKNMRCAELDQFPCTRFGCQVSVAIQAGGVASGEAGWS